MFWASSDCVPGRRRQGREGLGAKLRRRWSELELLGSRGRYEVSGAAPHRLPALCPHRAPSPTFQHEPTNANPPINRRQVNRQLLYHLPPVRVNQIVYCTSAQGSLFLSLNLKSLTPHGHPHSRLTTQGRLL